MRNDERVAIEALSNLLTKRRSSFHWELGSNPPDALFIVGGERWAVEITGLHRYARFRGGVKSERGIESGIESFAKRINQLVVSRHGVEYVLTLIGTFSIQTVEERLIPKIKEYLNSGKMDKEWLDHNGRITIQAFATPGEPSRITVWSAFGPDAVGADGSSMASNVYRNVEFALKAILGKKRPRVARLKGFDRRILLLNREYDVADARVVRDVLEQIRINISPFDSILLVTSISEIEVITDAGKLFQ